MTRGSTRRRLALALCFGALPACAIPPSDVHLAPLYSHHRLAAGGYSHEALGGIFEVRREDHARTALGPTGGFGPGTEGLPAYEVAVRPLFRTRRQGAATETDVLWPLGHFLTDDEETSSRFFPVFWWKRHPNEDGVEEIDWAVLPPFFLGGSGTPENSYFSFFPFYGTLRDFFTYDEIHYVLFPLYGSTRKQPGDRRAWAVLFPITGWGRGDDGASWWRFWPFYGTSSYEGHYDRTFVLWPFWHTEENQLNSANPSRERLLWPLYGQIDQGALHARSVLWPFFGWEWNVETGYSAWDGPWPLVRFVRNGSGRPYEHTRVLPLYSSYRGTEIDSTVYLWPIIWLRDETSADSEKSSIYVVPFFVRSRALHRRFDPVTASATEHRASTDLIWPLYQGTLEPDGHGRDEVLWPLPYPKLHGFRENWFPFFSLFSREVAPDGAVSTRFFLDLFRSEVNDRETRWSVPILGGRRSTSDGRVEWSLLLGLLRWESSADGTRLLLPAIPGPGFAPLAPVEESMPLETVPLETVPLEETVPAAHAVPPEEGSR